MIQAFSRRGLEAGSHYIHQDLHLLESLSSLLHHHPTPLLPLVVVEDPTFSQLFHETFQLNLLQ